MAKHHSDNKQLAEPISGPFPLELGEAGDFLHSDAMLLTSGRAGFEYILRAHTPKRVLMPRYTCDTMLQPLYRTGIPYEFYAIDQNLEIAQPPKLEEGDFILYTNYFGLKDVYSRRLSRLYGNALVLDCAHAFYMKPLPKGQGHTFYSPRKFFGLADGGMVYTDKKPALALERDVSYERFAHLIKKIDLGSAMEDFKAAEATLDNQPIKTMSLLTQRLLRSIDFEAARKKRTDNYAFLHRHLASRNRLTLPAAPRGPLFYPLLAEPTLRSQLVAEQLMIPRMWPNVLEWSKPGEVDYMLAEGIVGLPVDQRYGIETMQTVLELVLKHTS